VPAVTQNEPAWPAFKAQTLFGQLPHLETSDGLQVSQSAAIVRVLARRGGLSGATEADFVASEMLLEEYADLLNALGKAMYGGPLAERPARFAAFLGAEGGARKHLEHFEKLAQAGGAFTSTVTSGECAVACALHTLLGLKADVAEGLPKLAAFWAARKARTAEALAGLAPYYTPDSKEA
jgi:glutathione S-transferase